MACNKLYLGRAEGPERKQATVKLLRYRQTRQQPQFVQPALSIASPHNLPKHLDQNPNYTLWQVEPDVCEMRHSCRILLLLMDGGGIGARVARYFEQRTAQRGDFQRHAPDRGSVWTTLIEGANKKGPTSPQRPLILPEALAYAALRASARWLDAWIVSRSGKAPVFRHSTHSAVFSTAAKRDCRIMVTTRWISSAEA